MTQIDIISGFLGSGKTTLIKKLISEEYGGEKLVIIENEYGQIGIDSGFLKETSVTVSELNAGCICCSMVGDFKAMLIEVTERYRPDRIIIEPSGVGKLSDILHAVEEAACESYDLKIDHVITVIDVSKYSLHHKNFGEFYNDQIENAFSIVLSRSQCVNERMLTEVVEMLHSQNSGVVIITSPWTHISGSQILTATNQNEILRKKLEYELRNGMNKHQHVHDEHCTCDSEEHGHDCGCHNHLAKEIFTTWSLETPMNYNVEQLNTIFDTLDAGDCGMVLRAKGILPTSEGQWIHFDYVPQEHDVRYGGADYTGRLCVIGVNLLEEKLYALFHNECGV